MTDIEQRQREVRSCESTISTLRARIANEEKNVERASAALTASKNEHRRAIETFHVANAKLQRSKDDAARRADAQKLRFGRPSEMLAENMTEEERAIGRAYAEAMTLPK